MILRDNSKIKDLGLENYWDKIYSLIDSNKVKISEKIISTKDLSLGNQINILVACLNSIMCGNFNMVINDDLIKFARDFPKDIMKVLSNKVEKAILNDQIVKNFFESFVKIN